MHSVREMSGAKDVDYGVNLLHAFFTHLHSIDSTVECD